MTAPADAVRPSDAGASVMLRLTDIHSYYGNIHALQGISLEVRHGEIVTLLGANGAGKTTTLKTIHGLLHPRKGSIEFEGARHHRHARPRSREGAASASRRRAGASSRG